MLKSTSIDMKVAEQNYDKNYFSKKLVIYLSRGIMVLGLLSIICHLAIITRHYNTDFATIHDAIEKDEKTEIFDGMVRDKSNDTQLYTYFKYEGNKRTASMGFYQHGYLSTRTRESIGCMTAVLFIIAGTFGILASTQPTHRHIISFMFFSTVAITFCLAFLPLFIIAVSQFTQEANEIDEYDKIIYKLRPDVDLQKTLPSYKDNYDLSEVLFVANCIIALHSIQIIMSLIQTILALTSLSLACKAICCSRNGDVTTGSLLNKNMCLSSNSMVLPINQMPWIATASETDLPPQYETTLKHRNLASVHSKIPLELKGTSTGKSSC